MENSNEKATITVHSEKRHNETDDYTLVELSPEETLVEFSPHLTADPNQWIFVSYIMSTMNIRWRWCTDEYVLEQENVQRRRGATSGTQ